MKAKFLLGLFFLAGIGSLAAQNRCGSFQYGKRILDNNPSLSSSHQRIGNFIQSRLSQRPVATYNSRPASTPVIKIPVVIHIVYHLPVENIPDEAIQNQMKALKRDYRRMNEDSVNTPSYFKPFAADCNIEFELAKVDPQGRATNGIERIYSPVANWFNDDQVKHKSQFGATGWGLNIYGAMLTVVMME
ncbi:MAG: hypothetical protein JSS70_04605 [Bacteroidetes bacterium]|nr:hypothetical protein [Bacteroidota bacterium]